MRAFPVNEFPLAETIILNAALSSTPSSNPFFFLYTDYLFDTYLVRQTWILPSKYTLAAIILNQQQQSSN